MPNKYSFFSAAARFYYQARNYIKRSCLRKDNLISTVENNLFALGGLLLCLNPCLCKEVDNWNVRRGAWCRSQSCQDRPHSNGSNSVTVQRRKGQGSAAQANGPKTMKINPTNDGRISPARCACVPAYKYYIPSS